MEESPNHNEHKTIPLFQRIKGAGSEKILIALGLGAAFFTILSAMLPELTGWHKTSCSNHPMDHNCIIVTREVFGGIPKPVVASFYASASVALVCSFWLFSQRTKNYKRGTSDKRSTTKRNIKRRIAALYEGLSMKTLMKDKSAGLMHSCIYYGFLGLFAATIILEIDHLMPPNLVFLKGRTYEVYAFLADLSGVVFLFGCFWAIFRRYIQKVPRLAKKTEHEDAFNIVLLILLGITGFLVEAFRIAVPLNEHRYIEFEKVSFIGFPLARAIDDLMSANTLAIAHRWSWGIHIGLFLIFLIVLPATKLRHMATSPVNMYLSVTDKPEGALTPMEDLTESDNDSFGAGKITNFTWKQLFDTDACTVCGRCTNVCPANLTGKTLDPRQIVLSINDVMTSSGIPQVSPTVSHNDTHALMRIATEDITSRISQEEVFACTTCKACDDVCPVNIEIMDKIVDIRRHYTLMESEFPVELSNAYRGMENQENPWGLPQSSRTDWTNDLTTEVKVIDPAVASSYTDKEGRFAFDVLFWVGCAGSFDDRAKRTTRALAGLLERAGIRFGILASNERCTGDPARRSGNEYLFQMLAMANIETLKTVNPTTILTQCPHCFNTLKNEYPDFDGSFNVVHHTQYLLDLIETGRLDMSTAKFAERITLHDSCYLTRHNNIINEPREILKTVNGVEFIEMGRNRNKNFCCGAGGAQFFMEEKTEERINLNRSREALETRATTVVSECPFCAVMMSDGINALTQATSPATQVKDLAVVLFEALEEK